MKKFSKLLILALSLVLIATAFTVVALAAEDGAGEPTLSEPHFRTIIGEWESKEDGTLIGTHNGTVNSVTMYGVRPAYVYAEASADGNKFGVWTVNPGKGNTGDNWYVTIGGLPDGGMVTKPNGEGTKEVYKYNLGDYPYVAYDFDIMSPTGNFGKNVALSSFSFRTYAYHHVDNEYNYNKNTAGAVKDTGKTALDVPTSVVYSGLDDTPYNWQHVSIIARAYQDGESIKFEIKVYVNGKYTNGTTTTASTQYFNNKLLEDMVFAYVRQSAQKDTSKGNALVDFTGYVGSDITTWPDSDPSEWYEDKVAFDNPTFTHYQSDWDFDAIAKDTWARNKDSIPAVSEKSVASLTKADGTITYFADINSAIAAAAAGEKVTLLADLVAPVKVDKAITVDVGMHYTYNKVDYLVGAHDFDYYSSNGMSAEYDEATAIYTFTQSDSYYTIEWDPMCDGACDCPSDAKHIFNLVTTGVPGEKVALPFADSRFDFSDIKVAKGLEINFLGWSLTKGGEVIDLATFDAEAGAAVKLYPVYELTQYNLQAITSAGVVSYYMSSDLPVAVAKAGNNGRVKLMTDVYTECPTIEFGFNFTLDLNGYDLTRCTAYGNFYEATPDGNGGYVYGQTVTSTVGWEEPKNVFFFKTTSSNIKFEITSSVGGGSISSVSIQADTWKCGDEIVKRTATGITKGNSLFNSGEKTYLKYYINGGVSINIYQLFYQTYATSGHHTLDFNNMYYTWINANAKNSSGTLKPAPITSSGNYGYVITMLNNDANTITFTDCVLNFPYASSATNNFICMRTAGKDKSSGESQKNVVTFKNTDIIKSVSGSGLTYGWSVAIKIDNTKYDADGDGNKETPAYGYQVEIIYDNSRVYDVNYDGFSESRNTTAVAINGSIYKDSDSQDTVTPAGEGYEVVAQKLKYTYSGVIVDKLFAIDTSTDVNKINFDFVPANYTITYTKVVTKPVTVNYTDKDGNIIKTEQLRPGVDAINAPTVSYALESDPYRNILAQWVDENGNALGTTLGLDGVYVNWQDSYTFRPIKPTENIQYTGGLKDIFFNISFNSNFRYNLYLPAEDENLTVNSISGFTKGNAVMIDGYAYYIYTLDVGTTAAANNTEAVLNFTANGETYEQTLKLNALLYADIILATGDVEEEKLAVGNMARFIMEACKVSGVEIDEERFNAIISDAGVKDYAEIYDGDGNITTLSDYIYSVNYVIYQGNAYYKFVLKNAADAENIKFTLNGKNVDFTVNGAELILNSARVYDIIDTITITVNGKSANYSMLDNIEANPDSDLLKALYEFGLAAENYRAYIETIAE